MWFCLVSVGAVAAFVIIGSLWEKFQTNPTITGMNSNFSFNNLLLFPGSDLWIVDERDFLLGSIKKFLQIKNLRNLSSLNISKEY